MKEFDIPNLIPLSEGETYLILFQRLRYLKVKISVNRSTIKLVIAIGGDGTILHVSSLFNGPSETPPPVLGFGGGTLGFLMPFRKFI
jgi:NAD kinase